MDEESESASQAKKKRIFPFDIFLEHEYLQAVKNDEEHLFNKIKEDCGIDNI